jgi:hypothetical protein
VISIRIGEKREIVLDSYGNIAFVSELSAVGQNAITALSAQSGEMIHAMDDGMPTLSAVWEKYSPARFEAAARRVLMNVDGVLEVINFWQRKADDTLNYSAVIRTAFGDTQISGVLQG